MPSAPIKHPTAFLPLAMSLAALAIVLGHFFVYGIVHEADEGTPAHLFQILMAAQLPLIAWFAVKWLPQARSAALKILAMQAMAVVAALASVYFLT